VPHQQIIPIWGGLNNANSTSSTGLSDPVTGQQYNTGGLQSGDYFDLTEKEANQLSVTATGVCHQGRYRYVLVDSGATASNVKTGTVGFLRAGTTVASAVTINAGSGMTTGTYSVAANVGSGGGVGAVIQVIVASGAVVGNPTVLQGGTGYVSAPSFSTGLVALGGSGVSITAQLNSTPNVVTSTDIALSAASTAAAVGPIRPVVFLNAITPGNYGFVQELGTATVLAGSTNSQTAGQFAIVTSSSGNGTMAASATTFTIYTIGQVLDPLTSPLANTPFKISMGVSAISAQD
jgi:hypothetical protein